MFSAFLIFLMIACCQAQIPIPGPCMEMQKTADFDPTKILGRWYRYETYTSHNTFGRCRQSLFINNNDGSLTVIEKQLSTSTYYAWIETRAPHPSPSVIEKINEAIKVDGLQPKFLMKVNQTDCPKDF